jgi:hypothetical protein
MITTLDKDKNLALRTEILDKALSLEQRVNLLLLTYLSIETDERKAITNKSGNLSFKNKLDLLFDLEILDKEEYKQFLLLMEFRNQFLHNIDCNSFTYAIGILGNDKKNSLMKFKELDSCKDEEFIYNHCYKVLYSKSIKIFIDKIQKRRETIQDKAKLFTDLAENSIYLIESLFGLIDKLFETYMPNNSDSSETIKLKAEIFTTIYTEIENICSSDEYKKLQNQLTNSMTPEKLKLYFK